MAKNKNPRYPAKQDARDEPRRDLKPLQDSIPWYRDYKQLAIVIAVLAITFICFSPTLSSKKVFINWDDPVYITKQDLITKLDAQHLKKMFSDHDASLNYHPLTMLSLAVNYHFSKLNPTAYFITNVFIHLLNTFLVFLFLFRLSKLRLAASKGTSSLRTTNYELRAFWTGAIAALLFGIHPMHVESVAWAAERKDVLYCFFFLASCVTYLSYFETKKIKYLVFCFLLFVFSCLSKAMAVPLPMVLLLIDYYLQRKFSFKTVAEKIPFFLIAIVLGIAAIKIQAKGAISDFHQYTLAQKFMFSAYGFMMYWFKLFAPVNLSAFYPYPTLNNGDVSLIYKIALVAAPLMVGVPLFFAYKKNKETFRVLVFGFGFFILMIALVLQFLSVGAAIMADRYSYLPYIGAFFIIGSLVAEYLERKNTRNITIAFLAVATSLLAVGCYNRVTVWNNDEILWSDVIDKYPYITEKEGSVLKVKQVGVDIAYENRANYYRDHGEMDKAFADYELLTSLHSKAQGAYNNAGNFYGLKGQEAAAKGNAELAKQMFSKALDMYSEAIRLQPSDRQTIINRGITYSSMGDHQKAINDFRTAMRMNPADKQLFTNIAFEELQAGMYAESINDCNEAISANPNDANVLFYRGTAFINLGKNNDAINDLNLAVKINPSLANAWFNLSVANKKVGNNQQAREAALNAKKNGYPVSEEYLKGL